MTAWQRTLDEINATHLKETIEFIRDQTGLIKELNWDDSYLSLGAMFPIAHSLKLMGYLNNMPINDDSCRFVEEVDCINPRCRAHYVFITTETLRHKKEKCPYCDLERLTKLALSKYQVKKSARLTRTAQRMEFKNLPLYQRKISIVCQRMSKRSKAAESTGQTKRLNFKIPLTDRDFFK